MVMNLYLLFAFVSVIFCFNVDVDNVINIKEEQDTHFGYSALMFTNANNEKWVVVGATKANYTNENQDVYKTPGNIFKCPLNFSLQQQDSCIPMNMELPGIFRWPDSPGYEEDYQLLGATMAMIDDTIIACAPLWKNYIPWKSDHIVHPLGRCINLDKDFSKYTSYAFKQNPLKDDTGSPPDNSQFFFEFAEVGFSISQKRYENNQYPVLLGAPGLTENIGGFLRYDIEPTNTEVFWNAFTRASFQSQNIFHFGDLMGYAVTTGNVVNGSRCPDVVVVGAPHFATNDGIVGSVFVICASVISTTEKSDILKQFFGKKSGGGFGSALVFQDINNDGLDDLLVGEPMYFNIQTNVLDVGAVYIFYGSNDSSVTLETSGQVLNGSQKENGRFGSAMECIGDINNDDFSDVVIAAPYEDDLKGAIYIYHGGKSKLTLAQRITPEDIGVNLHSFGWYISAAYDIDNNKYPDFLVGSYMSDTVSVFRSRPIIVLKSTVETIPKIIPLNSSGELCEDKYFRPCVSVQLCFTYDGVSVPETIRLSYNMSADIHRTRGIPILPSRVGYIDDGTDNKTFIEGVVDVPRENGSCVIRHAVVQTVDRDFYATLEEELVFETGFTLSDMPILGEVQPILKNTITTVKETSANFSTGCNHTCHPDLHINTKLDSDVVFLGETSEIVLRIDISNSGEQSYGTRLLVDYSNNTQYIDYSQPQLEDTELMVCGKITSVDNETRIECDMDTAFFKGQKVALILRFAILRSLLIQENQTLENFNQDINIMSFVQSTTPDINDRDNVNEISVKVKLKSSVELSGISNPDQLQLSDFATKGILFSHSYSIYNYGPSPLNDYKFYICLPVKLRDDTKLVAKDSIKVKTTDKEMTWMILHYPEEPHETSTINNENVTETITIQDKNFTEEIPTVVTADVNTENTTEIDLSTTTASHGDFEQHSTSSAQHLEEERVVEIRDNLKFNVITCKGKTKNRIAILEIFVGVLERNKGIEFALPFNLSESGLDLEEVSGVIYRSNGELLLRNDERYVTISHNTTYDALFVSSEIYVKQNIAVESKQISIWIIIGASVGGLLLLIILGVLLKKCGFFKRNKREEVKKFKRQSGYYANRQSRVSMISSKVKSANWEVLNNDLSSFGKAKKDTDRKEKLVAISE